MVLWVGDGNENGKGERMGVEIEGRGIGEMDEQLVLTGVDLRWTEMRNERPWRSCKVCGTSDGANEL